MTATNLNYLFIDLLPNFSHLLTIKAQTKSEFLQTIKNTYSLENQKTKMFFISCEKSIFKTIRLSDNLDSILFNQ